MERSLLLFLAVAVLMVVGIIELSFISSMVAWIHRSAAYTSFTIRNDESTFELTGMPKHPLVDQGHASNGVAGTVFIVVGCGGIVALWLSRKPDFRRTKFVHFYYTFWVAASVLAWVYTLATLVYVFVVTNAHKSQSIDVGVASALTGSLDEKRYPIEEWTPQAWFAAVLQLDIVDQGLRSDIESHLRVMRGWLYNLIPIFLVQTLATVLIILDWWGKRKNKVETVHVTSEAKTGVTEA